MAKDSLPLPVGHLGNLRYVLLFLLWLGGATGCGTVASWAPGVGKGKAVAAPPGERLHLTISPEEALALLVEVAPQHGWQVVLVGDHIDTLGLRGKYFRLEPAQDVGGKRSKSGVFFSEPAGTYVEVGKEDAGLPESLVAPFTAAVERRRGDPRNP